MVSQRPHTIHDFCTLCGRDVQSDEEAATGRCGVCFFNTRRDEALERFRRDSNQHPQPDPEIMRLADDGNPLAGHHS
jgi:predicted nucleic acid-binding Zn ribbon protein